MDLDKMRQALAEGAGKQGISLTQNPIPIPDDSDDSEGFAEDLHEENEAKDPMPSRKGPLMPGESIIPSKPKPSKEQLLANLFADHKKEETCEKDTDAAAKEPSTSKQASTTNPKKPSPGLLALFEASGPYVSFGKSDPLIAKNEDNPFNKPPSYYIEQERLQKEKK